MNKKRCGTCRWRISAFTSVCCNGDSPRCGEQVDALESCDDWESDSEDGKAFSGLIEEE